MRRILLKEGTNVVSEKQTIKKFFYVSNNDACEKSVGFYCENERDIVVDGFGNTLLLDGDITGFVFKNCENIRLRNLKIDYTVNSHFELKVTKTTDKKIYLEERTGFPFRVVDGQIIRSDGRKVSSGLLLPYDEERRRPDYRTGIYRLGKEKIEGLIPLDLTLRKDEVGYYAENEPYYRLREGQVCVFMCYPRHNQAIVFDDCKNIVVENVEISYSPSMGIVAQNSENLRLDRVKIRANGRHGLISTCADATHFVNCCGKISLSDCDFFHMLDDGANFHGNYTKISSVEKNRIVTEIKHFQQYGVNVYKEGDIVDVYRGDTIEAKRSVVVKKSRLLTPSLIELTTDDRVDDISVGDTLDNAMRSPEVHIRGCRCGDNRPRSFLLTSSKSVLVEDCEFSNCAHAIDISGDTTYWFESGRVKDVLIKNNLFRGCNYNEGEYPIWIRPSFDSSAGKNYHKNIRIIDNTFVGLTDGIVQASFVDGLKIEGNTLIKSDEYPFIATERGAYYIENCDGVTIKP